MCIYPGLYEKHTLVREWHWSVEYRPGISETVAPILNAERTEVLCEVQANAGKWSVYATSQHRCRKSGTSLVDTSLMEERFT